MATPTHILEVQIPLAFPQGEQPSPDLVANGRQALQDLQQRAGITRYLAGSFQITVKDAP